MNADELRDVLYEIEALAESYLYAGRCSNASAAQLIEDRIGREILALIPVEGLDA